VTSTGAQSDLVPGSPLAGGRADLSSSPSVLGRISTYDTTSPSSPLGADDSGGGSAASLLRTVKRRQGLFLLTAALVTGALAVNTLRQRIFTPVYEGGFQLQISNPLEERAASTSGDNGTIESIARSTFKPDVPSLTVLLRSPLLIRPMADKQGIPVMDVIKNLTINPASQDVQNVLNISLRWSDPTKGRAILNALSQDYTRVSLTQRQAALESAITFLSRQGPQILTRMNQLQEEMLRFRKQNNFLDPSQTASTILEAREGLVAQLRDLQTNQVQLSSELKSIEAGTLQFTPSGAPAAMDQMGRQGLLIPGRGEGAEAVKGARTPTEQVYDLEEQLAVARGTFQEDSPVVQSLLARRNQLRLFVRQRSLDTKRAELFANLAQQDEINRQILLLNENFRSSPQRVSAYEDLQTRLDGAREQYSSYVAARERIRLELARSTTPWQIITPADFGDVPVEPNIQRDLLRAVLIGLLAGLGAAVLRERTDNVFHTPMEVEKELLLPVLGLIPYLPLEPGAEISSSISKMTASERFAIKESLRSLFTTFRLLRADRNIRLVGVTSSTQGEGKSTAVSIFARTLADLGLKVLIIDADMRLPMQGRYLGIEQGDGLSSLLSNSSLQAVSMIKKIQDNLDIIPAGPKPPDPAKLLNSSRCQEVVDQVRALPDYDIILWDAPPCLMLADPILLGEKLDGILFLVGLGKVSRDLAPQACRRIKATGVDVLGLICNQVSFPSRLNDYGYEYGYYYHYAYAGAYGKNKRAYGSYGEGLKGYIKGQIKGYRDSYISSAANGDSLLGRSTRSATGNLYMGDAYNKQGYQDASVRAEEEQRSGSSTHGASRARSGDSSRSGWRGWMAGRLPFGDRGKGKKQPSSPYRQQEFGDNDSTAESESDSQGK
jgi:capsular exopolysaccharide synthesis family protein